MDKREVGLNPDRGNLPSPLPHDNLKTGSWQECLPEFQGYAGGAFGQATASDAATRYPLGAVQRCPDHVHARRQHLCDSRNR